MKDLSEYRSEFPIVKEYSFFNNAATLAPPLRVAGAVSDFMLQVSHESSLRYREWKRIIETTRSLFGQLINADPSEICFATSTSEALSTVAGGISWRVGDKIIVPVPDFPSNVYPWLNLERLGVEVLFLHKNKGRFDVSDVKAVLRPGTRLITASSTDYITGFRCDLEELGDFCRQKGILFCVDAIQSLGAIPARREKLRRSLPGLRRPQMAPEHDGNRSALHLQGGKRSDSPNPGGMAKCRKRGGFL